MIIDSKQLPVGWSVSTIEEIADVNPRLNKAGIPDDLFVSFVPMSAVGAADGSIDVSGERLFGEVKKSFTAFQEGDVLFAKITPCMENGKMAIVPKVKNGIGFGSTEFHVLRPKDGIDARYIYYYVSSKNFRGEAERYMSGAVGQKRVTTPYLKECEIPIVPPDQQKRIVAEIEKQFSRLDEAVANLKRVKGNLKRYKAAVLKAAVEGRLVETEAELARRQGRDFETGEQLLRRILKTRRSQWQGKGKYKEPAVPDMTGLPELPEGWVWATLGQLVWSVKDGPHFSPKYANEGIPFISGGNVRPEGIDFSVTKFISPELHVELSKRCKPEHGDLLYTKGGTTGIARVNTETREFNVWVHVAVLKLMDSLDPFYLQHSLNSLHCYRQAQKFTHGVGNQDLGLTRMVWITVPLPSLAEQYRIVTEVDLRLSLVREVETQVETNLKRAELLRQSILQQAFTGRLVPPEPIDKSACRLLDGGQKGGKKKTTNKESVSP